MPTQITYFAVKDMATGEPRKLWALVSDGQVSLPLSWNHEARAWIEEATQPSSPAVVETREQTETVDRVEAEVVADRLGVPLDTLETCAEEALATERNQPPRRDWNLPQLFDYWDERSHALYLFSREVARSVGAERDQMLGSIAGAVTKRAQTIPDDSLVQYAWVMVDNLYKAACATIIWDDALHDYLRASAATFAALLHERGYRIHLVVDNTFSDPRKPLEMLGPWFNAAGLVYICPQAVARDLMRGDGIPETETAARLPQYIAEARGVANTLVDRCQEEGRHFIFLDTDSEEGSFTEALRVAEAPGVVHVFRNEAAVPGSNVQVHLPTARAAS